MKHGKLKKALFSTASVAIASAIVLVAFELFVRATWQDSPRDIRPVDDAIFVASSDPDAVMTLRGGFTGYHSLTHFRFNSLGYRGPEYSPRGQGRRVAIVGDSFIYGYALPERATIESYLQRMMREGGEKDAEVINAGVPAYNFEQNISRVKQVAADYHPDVVVVSFIHNDFANKFYALPSGILPVLTTSDEADNPKVNMLGSISEWMLPPARLKECTDRYVKIKYMLANSLWSYKYLAFRMHKAGKFYPKSGRRLTFPQTSSRQLDELIWRRIEKGMKDFRASADRNNFEPVLMLFMDYKMEGRPAVRLREIASRHRIPVIDLTPLWGSEKEYARKYSIAWDSHPNSKANRLAAQALYAALAEQDFVKAGLSSMQQERYKTLKSRQKIHLENAEAVAVRQRKLEYGLRKSFSDYLTPGEKGKGMPADQWLYGWWNEPFEWDKGGGKWMAKQSGFFLKPKGKVSTRLRIKGYRVETMYPPPALKLMVDCGEGTGGIISVPSGGFETTIQIKETQRKDSLLECELFATRVTTPVSLGVSKTDNRYISVAIKKIAVE